MKIVSVDCDYYGNPRYVVHYRDFLTEEERLTSWWRADGSRNPVTTFEHALERARKIGGKKYRARWYGGGIVITHWGGPGQLEEEIKALLAQG